MPTLRLSRGLRVATIATLSSGIAIALAVLVVASRERSADALVREARARLDAPFLAAPTLDRLQASTAISLLERARELGRDDRATRGLARYAEAIEDLQRGDLILAEGELASALALLGPTADLHVLAASLSRGRLLLDDAEREIAIALELDPDHARGRLLAADLELDRGRGAPAREHLAILAEREPTSGPVWNRLGLAREMLRDLPGAEDAYRRATELDRVGQDPWINLGRLLRATGRDDASLRAFEAAVARARGDSAAHLGRGLARAALGDLEGAREDFRRAAELAPNDAEPLLALGDLLREAGHVDAAIATYREAIAREDADAASWVKLGNALALVEQWAPAARAFREATERAPDLAAARNGLGAALIHLDRRADARAELERAAALDPIDPNPLMNLAVLAERSGDRRAARAAWARVLERAPESAYAQARLARLPG
jgi:tetratricopeptide (TPR) repeat protein